MTVACAGAAYAVTTPGIWGGETGEITVSCAFVGSKKGWRKASCKPRPSIHPNLNRTWKDTTLFTPVQWMRANPTTFLPPISNVDCLSTAKKASDHAEVFVKA